MNAGASARPMGKSHRTVNDGVFKAGIRSRETRLATGVGGCEGWG
jgi:hypothetical protein